MRSWQPLLSRGAERQSPSACEETHRGVQSPTEAEGQLSPGTPARSRLCSRRSSRSREEGRKKQGWTLSAAFNRGLFYLSSSPKNPENKAKKHQQKPSCRCSRGRTASLPRGLHAQRRPQPPAGPGGGTGAGTSPARRSPGSSPADSESERRLALIGRNTGISIRNGGRLV